MLTAKEVETAIEAYNSRFWDLDHPLHDEDEESGSLWDFFQWDENNHKVPLNVGPFTVQFVESGSEMDTFNDKIDYMIIKVGDQTFKMEGWSDSWGGDNGWDGPFYEVKQVEKTIKVWEKQND